MNESWWGKITLFSHKKRHWERTREGTAFPLSLHLCVKLSWSFIDTATFIFLKRLVGDLFHKTKFLPWIEKEVFTYFFPLKPSSAVNFKVAVSFQNKHTWFFFPHGAWTPKLCVNAFGFPHGAKPRFFIFCLLLAKTSSQTGKKK